MPTYVYECSACSTVFELEQRITESPIDTCQCGSKGTVKRVIQPVGISFKGSGFYVNDSRSVGTTTGPVPSETETAAAAQPASPIAGPAAAESPTSTPAPTVKEPS